MRRSDPSEHLEHQEARIVTTLRKWENLILLAIVVFVVGGAVLIGILKLLFGSPNLSVGP
jgi:hypothetical protein